MLKKYILKYKMHDLCWFAFVVAALLVLIWINKCSECGETKIIWFYRANCGFCSRMVGEWNLFVQNAPDHLRIQTVDVANPANYRMAREYGVEGVPHIVKVKNGRKYVYKGPRKAADFLRWSVV